MGAVRAVPVPADELGGHARLLGDEAPAHVEHAHVHRSRAEETRVGGPGHLDPRDGGVRGELQPAATGEVVADVSGARERTEEILEAGNEFGQRDVGVLDRPRVVGVGATEEGAEVLGEDLAGTVPVQGSAVRVAAVGDPAHLAVAGPQTGVHELVVNHVSDLVHRHRMDLQVRGGSGARGEVDGGSLGGGLEEPPTGVRQEEDLDAAGFERVINGLYRLPYHRRVHRMEGARTGIRDLGIVGGGHELPGAPLDVGEDEHAVLRTGPVREDLLGGMDHHPGRSRRDEREGAAQHRQGSEGEGDSLGSHDAPLQSQAVCHAMRTDRRICRRASDSCNLF